MPSLNVETGLTEYDINGKVKVLINPTDPNLIERFYSAFSDLSKKQDEYDEKMLEGLTDEEVFEYAKKQDQEMRSMIDGAFGAEVCAPVFGNLSVYAQAGGLPLWANLMLAIIEEMDSAFAREKKASDPRLKKYTERFKRK